MDFFAECKTEPGSEVFLQPLSLRPSIFQLYSHLFAQIHFLNHTLLNGHSITLFQLFYGKNLASPVLLRFTVNPIIQSASHQTATTRFWCHLCRSKVSRDTAGAWDPRLPALWRSTFQSNGFHLSKPNSFPPETADLGSHGSFLWPDWL